MTVLAIQFWFPGGRYHATPWDHHVNEGIVEWPPSPWRVLRALIATWHLKARDEVDASQMARLIEALAAEPPAYWLPPAAPGHTRHYMPLYDAKTTKIFDAFLHVGTTEPLCVAWPSLELERAERLALSILVEKLTYLGRAESWVRAEITEPPDRDPDCVPIAEASREAEEIVRLLAPLNAEELVGWRAAALDEQLTARLAEARQKRAAKGRDPEKARLTSKDRAAVEADLPGSVVAALEARTDELRKSGWSQPPGSRWLEYDRPAGLLLPRVRARSPRPPSDPPTVARYALAGSVLPRLSEAVSVADRVRTGLLSRSESAPVFSGRDESGALLSGHRHAFIIPEADLRSGAIRTVTIHAPMGFDEAARAALDRLTRVWGHGGHDLQLVLTAVGQPDDVAGWDREAGQCPLLVTSRSWVSRTPFVPTRHPKLRAGGVPRLDSEGLQIGGPEHDLRRLLAAADFPAPEQVEPILGTRVAGKFTRWLAFRTDRQGGGGRRSAQPPAGFRLVFAEPVTGPIAVGYGAHFGLGVFEPEITPERR